MYNIAFLLLKVELITNQFVPDLVKSMAGKVLPGCGKAVCCVANLQMLPEAMCG